MGLVRDLDRDRGARVVVADEGVTAESFRLAVVEVAGKSELVCGGQFGGAIEVGGGGHDCAPAGDVPNVVCCERWPRRTRDVADRRMTHSATVRLTTQRVRGAFSLRGAPLRPLLRGRRLPVWPGNHVTFGFDRTPRRGGQSRDGAGWVYADTDGAFSARRVWQGRNGSRVCVVRPILSG